MSSDFRETLYTIDKAGHRKWVYSNVVSGFWYKRRAIIAYLLMAFYLLMPWLVIGGKQAIRLDFTTRQFTFFGTTFWASDTVFLFLVLSSLALTLFFVTALFGRLWCGWACPETVFLEYLFRPIEKLIEGSGAQRLKLDQAKWSFDKIKKKFFKHGLCAAFSWVIATTALAYVIGAEPLLRMIVEGPGNHLVPFSMTIILMAVMAFQFGWFREQFCTIVCPYARFQSVMMDPNSLVIGYDPGRGEPRGKSKSGEQNVHGDCIDCGLCIRVCPTGIDIRNGLQLECIGCAQCVDACDSIMAQIGKPPGLIRYDTENRLLGKNTKILRPRVFVYATILLTLGSIFVFKLAHKAVADFQVIRGPYDAPFAKLSENKVSNHLTLKILNKSDQDRKFSFNILEKDKVELITPVSPFPVSARQLLTTPIFLNFDPAILAGGKLKVHIGISDGQEYQNVQEVMILGPGK